MLSLTLYQPEIPQNTGTLLRLAACLGIDIDIIEPCGFLLSDRRFRRAGMDYIEAVQWHRHENWAAFQRARDPLGPLSGRRLLALTTEGAVAYSEFSFQADDIIMVGQESIGLPPSVLEEVSSTLMIPMVKGQRSLNVAVAAAMVVGEALRQTRQFPLPLR